jgi:hypothetical protein
MMAETPSNARLDALLDRLSTDLEPVTPLDDRPAVLFVAGLLVLVAAALLAWIGPRPGLMNLPLQPMFLLRCGTLAVLAVISVAAVLAQAHPAVGRGKQSWGQGWKVAAAMAALFPLVGAVMALTDPDHARAVMAMPSGWQCLRMSLMSGALCAVPMVLHLRRGAPVAPERAGLLVGLAAGSLGALAYNLHCPFDSMVYIGLWYGLAVVAAAVAGRLVVPRLIRW